MAKSKKRTSYDPMKSSVIQVGVVFIIIAALALAYTAGMLTR